MNAERLLKLADYLEKDTQPFSMLGWESCAIARCQHIWPENWIIPPQNPLSSNYELTEITVIPKDELVCPEFKSAMQWFDLTEQETEDLFCYADETQTREQTVQKIRQFVRDKENKSNLLDSEGKLTSLPPEFDTNVSCDQFELSK